MPSRSPVFTKPENDEIHKFLAIYWSTLGTVEKQWQSATIHDLRTLEGLVGGYLNHRWGIIERFAKMTTRRLEDVRKVCDLDLSVKKASVSQEHLAAYMETKGSAENLVRYLRMIVTSNEEFSSVVSYRLGRVLHTFDEARNHYIVEISKLGEALISRIEMEFKLEEAESLNIGELEQAVYFYCKLQCINENIERQKKSVHDNSYATYKQHNSLLHLYGSCKNRFNTENVLSRFSLKVIDTAIDFVENILDGHRDFFGNELDSMIHKHSWVLEKDWRTFLSDSGLRQNAAGKTPHYVNGGL
jgi:hypothetical protein